ncbi:hypothetical protein GCM10010378_25670 [Streptomyces viridochromogenes]
MMRRTPAARLQHQLTASAVGVTMAATLAACSSDPVKADAPTTTRFAAVVTAPQGNRC